jgi:2-phospho-L-lactate guanylyltransferase
MTLFESGARRPDRPDLSGQTVALIPVRSLTSGKSRLAGALEDDQRSDLIGEMLGEVVAAASGSGVVDRVIVISPDDAVLSLAGQFTRDLVTLRQDPDQPGLVAALDQGRAFATGQGAAAMLILFGDLPLLGTDDVRAMVASAAPVVISPDRHGRGTNGLLLRSGQGSSDALGQFRFRFGEDSFQRHLDEADRLRVPAATVVTAGTSLDVDTPADLAEWSRRSAITAAH